MTHPIKQITPVFIVVKVHYKSLASLFFVSIMDKYDLTIRVDREQEEAIRALFAHNKWNFEQIGKY